MYDTDNYRPVAPSQLSFVEEFQVGILTLISKLPIGTGVYAPTCLVHCLSGQLSFTQLTTNNVSLNMALTSWYFDNVGVAVVSDCIGYNCVNACGVDLMTSLPCNMGAWHCSALNLLPEAGGTTSTDVVGKDSSDVNELMTSVLAMQHYPAGTRAPPPPSVVLGAVSAFTAALSGEQQSSLRSSALASGAPGPQAAAAATATVSRSRSAHASAQHRSALSVPLLGAALLFVVACWFMGVRNKGSGKRMRAASSAEVDLPQRRPVYR